MPSKTSPSKARKSFSRNKASRTTGGKPSVGGKSAVKFSPRPRAPIGKPRSERDAAASRTLRDAGKVRPAREEKSDGRRHIQHDERRDDRKPYTPKFGKSKFGDAKPYSKRPAFGRPNTRPDTRREKPKDAPRGEDVRRIQKDGSRDTVLIWGLHAARAAWLNPARKIHRIWLTEGGQKIFEASQNEAREELLKRPDAKIQDRTELDRITPPASVHQGIVIEASPVPEPSLYDIINAETPPDLILVLDQVTDPHNVGAILRSAAAFGAGAVIMTERNAPTTTGVLAKSASGALEYTPMIHVVNLARAMEDLRNAGYWSVGLAEEGEKDLGQIDVSGRTALVLGAEGEGLRHLTRQKCDELARLPTGGPVGSLNVSNAAAVALYEVRRQAKAK